MKYLLVALFFFPLQSQSWGGVGHRTVALVADSKLSPEARRGVQRLLGMESMADVSSWADDMRESGLYRRSHEYHFESLPDNVKFLDNLKTLSDSAKRRAGAVEAILYADKVLRDPNASGALQSDALKFLIHFVGDIHQPLHTGRESDVGGLRIKVDWFGDEQSLHQIWDSGLIMQGHADILQGLFSRKASTLYAAYLLSRTMPPVVEATDVQGWLNEVLAMRLNAYDPINPNTIKQYVAKNTPLVDQKVYAAGVRLAEMLNSIFANEPTSAVDLQFRTDIEAISGPIDQVISFSP